MKKLFAFVAAALVSVATFASREVVPSDADLASYATGTYSMCIYNDGACNDIVLIGTYVGWSTSAELVTFQPVTGFDGWYVATWEDATEPSAEGGIQAKPVQLDGSGNFNWDYQLGADAELIRGTADILPGNTNEVDIKNIAAGIVVIDVKSWKSNPCTAIYHTYSVTLISPDCNAEDYITPAISGGFNGWAQQAMEMNELKTAERQAQNLYGAVFEVSFRAAEGSEFKFRSSEEWGAEWTNELKEYDAENDEWKAYNDGANITLGEETTLTYDLGDPTLYSWNNCEKPQPVDSTKYVVVVNLKVPANAPAAGVEIIGDFDGWIGKLMALENTGLYFVALEDIMGFQVFKFREAGTWDNEIVYVDKVDDGKPVGFANMRFDDNWVDATYKGDPCKEINLDFSDPAKYVWTTDWTAPDGIENVVLTEKAQKVMVDGVLYIVRDNKLFNVQGTQVR